MGCADIFPRIDLPQPASSGELPTWATLRLHAADATAALPPLDKLKVLRVEGPAGGWTTVILRRRPPGAWGRSCPLCPRARCTLDAEGECLVAVPARVEDADAGDFSLTAWLERDGGQ